MVQDEYAINCSLCLRDTPLFERANHARRLGYRKVEYWWPFGQEAPEKRLIAEFARSVREAEVDPLLLNFPGGGPAVSDRGLLVVPGFEKEFFDGAKVAVELGQRLGVRNYNPMVGNISGEWSAGSLEFETAVRNLRRVSTLVGEAGGILVIEPLSGFPNAAIRTVNQAVELVEEARAAGAENVGVLLDLYHVAQNNDTDSIVSLSPDLVKHVQVADAPGRGWPGSGELPLRSWLGQLRRTGYAGAVGLECTGAPVERRRVVDALSL